MPTYKERRKNLGWTRVVLAERANLNKQVIQLIELGQWSEEEAIGRVEYVLRAAESGELDVQLPPLAAAEGMKLMGRPGEEH